MVTSRIGTASHHARARLRTSRASHMSRHPAVVTSPSRAPTPDPLAWAGRVPAAPVPTPSMMQPAARRRNRRKWREIPTSAMPSVSFRVT